MASLSLADWWAVVMAVWYSSQFRVLLVFSRDSLAVFAKSKQVDTIEIS
jgi:hypothetical protein